jgi:hypothetical protein
MNNKDIAFIVNQIFKASNDTNVDKLLEAFRNKKKTKKIIKRLKY